MDQKVALLNKIFLRPCPNLQSRYKLPIHHRYTQTLCNLVVHRIQRPLLPKQTTMYTAHSWSPNPFGGRASPIRLPGGSEKKRNMRTRTNRFSTRSHVRYFKACRIRQTLECHISNNFWSYAKS